MKRHWLDLGAQARYRAHRHEPDGGDAIPAADRGVDAALRYFVRAQVAGVTAPARSWTQLQRRLSLDAQYPERAGTRVAAPARQAPATRFGASLTSMRPYLSQVSMAMLLFLAVLGSLLPAPSWTPSGTMPTVVPSTAISEPARPFVRPNRGLMLADGDQTLPAAAPATVSAPNDTPAPITYTGHGPDGAVAVRSRSADLLKQEGPDQGYPGGYAHPPYTPALGIQHW